MNGNDPHRTYTDAVTAQLGERVTNLGRRQSDMESEMRSGFKQVDTAIGALSAEMRNSVAALATNLSERNKPQWQALGVALTFASILGALAYWPIQSATSDLKSSVSAIAATMITRQEMDWRQARGAEDRARMEITVKDIRDAQVPRAELERVWSSQANTDSDQQRQIDELKQSQSSVYGARDVILDLRQRVDRMEREKTSAAN